MQSKIVLNFLIDCIYILLSFLELFLDSKFFFAECHNILLAPFRSALRLRFLFTFPWSSKLGYEFLHLIVQASFIHAIGQVLTIGVERLRENCIYGIIHIGSFQTSIMLYHLAN